MKTRYFVRDGKVITIAQLSSSEQHDLRKKNINLLLEQAFYERVFKETVSFADRGITHV